jgi:hypothetical protein
MLLEEGLGTMINLKKDDEINIISDEYKRGFGDAIFHVIRILNDNSNLQHRALVSLLNTVAIETTKNHPRDP